MGVDILPSERPRESSAYFGDRVAPIVVALIKAGLSGAALPPHIAGACVTDGGRLMPAYAYIRCPLRSTLTVLYHGLPRTGTLIGCARRGGPCSAAASQHANGSAPPRDGGGARRGGRPDDGGAAAAWAPLRLQPDQPGQFSITCMRPTRPSTVSNEGCLHFLQLFSPLYVFLLLLAPCARSPSRALALAHPVSHAHYRRSELRRAARARSGGAGIGAGAGALGRERGELLAGRVPGQPGRQDHGPHRPRAPRRPGRPRYRHRKGHTRACTRTCTRAHARTQTHARNTHARTHASRQGTHAQPIVCFNVWLGASFRPDGWVCVQDRDHHTRRDRIDREQREKNRDRQAQKGGDRRRLGEIKEMAGNMDEHKPTHRHTDAQTHRLTNLT